MSMTREIKFRAWVKPLRKMANVYTLGLSGIEGTTVSVDGELRCGLDWTTMELMQYTGLKDKNGKDIYEGDIVKGSGYEGTYYAPVIFENCKFSINPYKAKQVKNKDDWKHSHDQVDTNGFITHWSSDGFHTLKTGWSDIEVIGNIYENPELLQKKEA